MAHMTSIRCEVQTCDAEIEPGTSFVECSGENFCDSECHKDGHDEHCHAGRDQTHEEDEA